MFEICSFFESRVVPVKVLHPSVQVGVVVTDTTEDRE